MMHDTLCNIQANQGPTGSTAFCDLRHNRVYLARLQRSDSVMLGDLETGYIVTPFLVKRQCISRQLPTTKELGVIIDSCITNVLFQAQRKRTVTNERLEQIPPVLKLPGMSACHIGEFADIRFRKVGQVGEKRHDASGVDIGIWVQQEIQLHPARSGATQSAPATLILRQERVR